MDYLLCLALMGSFPDVDLDEDGYTELQGDCAPCDAAANPGEDEVCDEIDNDCDEDVDEGVQTAFHADADEDGYGASPADVYACEASATALEDGTDCDDTNPEINPGMTESVCDGLDDDCDTQVDEGLTTSYYPDTDADGYGDWSYEETPLVVCEQEPTGYVLNFEDCDDQNPAIKPGATEVCDTVDNDCDEEVDEDNVCEP